MQIGRAAAQSARCLRGVVLPANIDPTNGSPLARVLFVTLCLTMFELHGPCPPLDDSGHLIDREARADLKECCTPRSSRVQVKRIACSNGPTSAYNPQTRGRRVRMDFVDERPHYARPILPV